MHRPEDLTDRYPKHTLGAAEWKMLIVAAVVVLTAYALVSQLPHWLGW